MNEDKDFFNQDENFDAPNVEEKTSSEYKADETVDEHVEQVESDIKKNEADIKASPLTDDILFSENVADFENSIADEIKREIEMTPQEQEPIKPQGEMDTPSQYSRQSNDYNDQSGNANAQNSYQVPPVQSPYQNQNSGWQSPRQQPPYQPQYQQPPQNQPQPPVRKPSNQQTQWTFNDYGPMQPPRNPQAEPNKQKLEKEDKKPKKPRSPAFGIKVFAAIISLMFVLSIGAFASYVVYDISKDNTNITNSNKDDNIDNPSNDGENNSVDKPILNVDKTPDGSADTDNDGVLSGREINGKVSPSVVGVAVYAKSAGYQLAGQGSGIIMTKDGYVITNAHVVSDKTNQISIAKIEIILSDGNTHEAKLVGLDIKTDLAVLKITADNLTPAEFGDSDKLRIGDDVFVIGNPSGIAFAGSFTKGTVSSLSRSIYMQQLGAEVEYIQTDAAINPGNSGGAFINEYGQVVGISSAKILYEGYEGMGFAIPINNAKDVIDSLISNGYVSGRPRVGIRYDPITETLAKLNGLPHGVRVVTVEEDSDAFKQGVKPGDIISKMDDKETYDDVTIAKALEGKKPGEKIALTIYRVDENGRSSTFIIEVTLGEMVS